MTPFPTNRQVIVVDDDPDLLYIAAKACTKAGYQPITAENGVDALRQIVANPDCRRMVTDFTMPLLGGATWIELLERFCPGWSIVVISSDDIDSGRFPFVPKPADFANLLTWFERHPS